MINKDNLKDLLKALNFEEKSHIYIKHFVGFPKIRPERGC